MELELNKGYQPKIVLKGLSEESLRKLEVVGLGKIQVSDILTYDDLYTLEMLLKYSRYFLPSTHPDLKKHDESTH